MANKKIGDLLVERGVLEEESLQQCLIEQEKNGQRLTDILLGRELITEDQLVEAMAERLKMPKISLESLIIDPRVIKSVPVEIAKRYTLLPVFRIGKTITVAMADPLNIIAIDELAYLTGCEIRRAIATEHGINNAIERYYSVQERLKSVIGIIPNKSNGPDSAKDEQKADEQNEAPVVQLVHLIITKAVREGASDIHVEPSADTLRVRYRIHGRMREEAEPPKSLQAEITSRIKIAANLDVSEKRIPQDGRFSHLVEDTLIDLRISTLPTIHGEKVVIRILDPRKIKKGLSQLGLTEQFLVQWQELINSTEGLVLISGPTSSGKTTTLYASLQEINSIEKNIITVEDPVEYSLPLINQVQTNERAGLTFAASLRSILRQNPDIIMIGEIRDDETATMAVRAALTGHLVFSTIHANDSAGSVTRLADIGVASFLVASALKGALAQRLVRLNCLKCLETYEPPEGVIQIAGLPPETVFHRSTGCAACEMSGYSGMSALYEYLPFDNTIREMIIRGDSDSVIKTYAREQGMETLFEAGVKKVIAGEITLEELVQVVNPDRHAGNKPSSSLTIEDNVPHLLKN